MVKILQGPPKPPQAFRPKPSYSGAESSGKATPKPKVDLPDTAPPKTGGMIRVSRILQGTRWPEIKSREFPPREGDPPGGRTDGERDEHPPHVELKPKRH